MTGLLLAIDFGTATTAGAYRLGDEPPRVVAVDGAAWMPSVVPGTADGTCAAGGDAPAPGRSGDLPPQRGPKAALAAESPDAVPAVRAVLAKVCDAAKAQAGQGVDRLVLTHPADWGPQRLALLGEAARGLVDDVVFVAEAVAAAAAAGIEPGQSVAVLDLGAGTCDAAVVRHEPTGLHVLSCAALSDLGGDGFDERLVAKVSRGADLPGQDAADLRRDVVHAKELLSRQASVAVQVPGSGERVEVSQAEFEELVAPDLERAARLLTSVIGLSEIARDELAGVRLTGGGSRIPLLERVVLARTPARVTVEPEPETAIARGALALAEVPPETSTSDTPAGALVAASRERGVPGVRGIRGIRGVRDMRGIRGVTPALAVLTVLVLVAGAVLAARSTPLAERSIAGQAQPAPGAVRPAAPAAGFPPALPGAEIIGPGGPEGVDVPPGGTGTYRTREGQTLSVRVDGPVAVTDGTDSPGWRTVQVSLTVTNAGDGMWFPTVRPEGADLVSLSPYLSLTGADGSRMRSDHDVTGARANCGQSQRVKLAPLAKGQAFAECVAVHAPATTAISGIVFGSPVPGVPDPARLRFAASAPAGEGPPALDALKKVGQVRGGPVEMRVGRGSATVGVHDLLTSPGAYLSMPEPVPGERYAVVRLTLAPSDPGAFVGTTADGFVLVDANGDRYDQVSKTAYTLRDCPSFPGFAQSTDAVAGCLVFGYPAAVTPAGVAYAPPLEPQGPDWSYWGVT